MTEEREPIVRQAGQAVLGKVKELIHEGNVRHVVIRNDAGRTVMDIPLTAGVVAACAAPVVTAISAIAALANDWSIKVEQPLPPSDPIVIDAAPTDH
ncbi:MAG TPA: DUF4342 domain-containing protein [Actinophytocola sp.]|uniref:DUF4342 domain-containing protein n=1 Tax=Actinophytocola sp. TaxID=1872138 RepID=UPI002DB5A557|nr:DUF4342 domain-containing protein [Actinophytocola sp.]HEU5475493.1 DUF4342 domain-containing protein [Actinophytocola sp.]